MRALRRIGIGATNRGSRHIGRLQQSTDVAIAKGEVLPFRARRSKRNMVGHQHAAIADITVGLDRLRHIHRTFVGKNLDYDIVATTAHVAEMNQEYLLAFAKPADHVVDLMRWVLEIL